jgi:hypothetical protein
MLCPVLLKSGIKQVAVIEQEMFDWMEACQCESVSEMHASMSEGK